MNSPRDHALQPQLDIERRGARRQTGAVADPEHMGVDRHGVFAEGHVEHDIGGLAAGAGQEFDLGAGARYFAVEIGDQLLRQRDHVLGFIAIEPDGLDVVAYRVLAERQHLLRRVGDREQRPRRPVDAGVGRLRRQHDRDQQRIGIEVLEFALRFRIGFAKPAEGFVNLGRGPGVGRSADLREAASTGFSVSPFGGSLLGDGLLRSALFSSAFLADFLGCGLADDFGHDPDILSRHDRRQSL